MRESGREREREREREKEKDPPKRKNFDRFDLHDNSCAVGNRVSTT